MLTIINNQGMQIKMRHHFTPVWVAIIKKIRNNNFWWDCGEGGARILLVGIQISNYEKQHSVSLKKTPKNRTAIWSNPTPGHISRGNEVMYQRHLHAQVDCNIFHSSQDLEKSSMPNNGSVDKKNMACILNEMLCSHKKGWNLSFTTVWTDLGNIISSEISQIQTDTSVCTHSYVQSKKVDLIEIDSRKIVTRGWEGDGR
jgi:hypothetical protein